MSSKVTFSGLSREQIEALQVIVEGMGGQMDGFVFEAYWPITEIRDEAVGTNCGIDATKLRERYSPWL